MDARQKQAGQRMAEKNITDADQGPDQGMEDWRLPGTAAPADDGAFPRLPDFLSPEAEARPLPPPPLEPWSLERVPDIPPIDAGAARLEGIRYDALDPEDADGITEPPPEPDAGEAADPRGGAPGQGLPDMSVWQAPIPVRLRDALGAAVRNRAAPEPQPAPELDLEGSGQAAKEGPKEGPKEGGPKERPALPPGGAHAAILGGRANGRANGEGAPAESGDSERSRPRPGVILSPGMLGAIIVGLGLIGASLFAAGFLMGADMRLKDQQRQAEMAPPTPPAPSARRLPDIGPAIETPIETPIEPAIADTPPSPQVPPKLAPPKQSKPQQNQRAALPAPRAKPPLSALKPPPLAKGGYRVQVGVFGSVGNAKRLAQRLQRMGFKAEVVARARSGGQTPLQMVRLSAVFADAKAARVAVKQLSDKGIAALVKQPAP